MSNDVFSSLLLALLLVALPGWAADPGATEPDADSSAESAAQSPDDGGPSPEGEVRALGGTSVIGNRELPKSLYIVPWKNSEVGVRTDLSRDLLDEGLTPVDPQEFNRQVQYYEFHQQQQ